MKSILIKIGFCIGIIVITIVYFTFKLGVDDERIVVQATHSCSGQYYCIGTCDAGYSCRIPNGSSICGCQKISAPTATPIPTSRYTCDEILPSCSGGPYECLFTCDTCNDSDSSYVNTKSGDCYTDGCRALGKGPCTRYVNISASNQCGVCPATNVTPPLPTLTIAPTGCQPIDCTNSCNMPECSDNCGSFTSCGATSCNSCSGGGADPTNIPLTATVNPTCSPQCDSDPCRANTCSTDICIGTCGGNCYGSLTCNIPFLGDLTITNSDELVMEADTNGRNNICEAGFDTSTNPRQVTFVVNAGDMDGYSNIVRVELSWAGVGYTLDFVSGQDEYAVYSKTVLFDADQNNNDTYPIEVKITDNDGKSSGWVDSGRLWKVWSCEMNVSGYLYDGSLGQSCNNTGFTSVVNGAFGFSSLLFRNAGVGWGVLTTVNIPDNFTASNLYWGRTYLPIFNDGSVGDPNGSLPTTSRMIRVIDLGTGVTSCPVSDEFDTSDIISAYSTTPSALIDFSFIKDNEGWFQVAGAGIKAKSGLSSGVPLTANVNIRALSISKALADNGLVSFSTFTNINGYNSEDAYGLTNNWWIDRNTNDPTTYSYQYFYNNFFINRDMGVTGPDWTSKPSNGIYFVNGNLNIDSDFSLAPGGIFMVVAKGSITIADTVNRLDGIYIADGGITASGTSSTQLVINGMLYSRNNIRLSRSYTDIADNNSNPAILVNYQPSLIFNMPGTLMRVLSGWREE
jgi:hypothetical protein